MKAPPFTFIFTFTCALAFMLACAGLSGCAGVGPYDPAPDAPGLVKTPSGQTLPVQAALDTIVIGKSTRSDVRAALGPAVSIMFDTGYEVWVYRWKGSKKTTRAATELVILFAPTGVAKKARIRPGYEGGD